MLDAYIIDRIQEERRRERERRESFIPLHIEVPLPVRRPEPEAPEEGDERGSSTIDFQL